LADLIDDNIERIASVETLDMAMLEESLRLRVIGRGARNFRAYADLAEHYEPRRWASNGTRNTVLRMPAGPTVVITPWNAPFMLSTWKCAPALAAAIPSSSNPPSGHRSAARCSWISSLRRRSLPVCSIWSKESATKWVPPWSLIRAYVGSPYRVSETGRRIGTIAARNLVPFTGELGGKGPFVVYADADLDLAVEKAALMYDDAGQVCLAGTRLIVEASIRDEFLERFTAQSELHVLGDSRDATTTVSPLIHPDHLKRVEGSLIDPLPRATR